MGKLYHFRIRGLVLDHNAHYTVGEYRGQLVTSNKLIMVQFKYEQCSQLFRRKITSNRLTTSYYLDEARGLLNIYVLTL